MRARGQPLLDGDLTGVTARLRSVTVQIDVAGRGGGCGVIWSSNGLIVTNAHVVAAGERARIVLPGGRAVDGRLLAADADRDLAALLIDVDNLPRSEERRV